MVVHAFIFKFLIVCRTGQPMRIVGLRHTPAVSVDTSGNNGSLFSGLEVEVIILFASF